MRQDCGQNAFQKSLTGGEEAICCHHATTTCIAGKCGAAPFNGLRSVAVLPAETNGGIIFVTVCEHPVRCICSMGGGGMVRASKNAPQSHVFTSPSLFAGLNEPLELPVSV